MKKTVLLLVSLFVLLNLCAQDSVQVRQYIRDLSSPAMHGRGYAYHGDSIAAHYIRTQFQRMNIPPFVYDDYFHRYDFPVYAMEGPVVAELNNKRLEPWSEFSLAPISHSAHQHFRIIPIEISKLLDKEQLRKFVRAHEREIDEALLYVDMSKCKDAEQRKKLHGIFQHFSVNNGRMPFKGVLVGVEEMPVWTFAFAHEPCDYVVAFIKADKMKRSARDLYLSYNNDFKQYNTQNVCAMISGIGEPDTIVVVGAHYDHLGQMGDALIFPGAHDNASGVAAVLDMAQYFQHHPPYYSMLFVLFSGEEAGLLGSSAFVRDSLLDFGKIKMMLNVDLMGGGDDGFTVVNADGANTAGFFQSMVNINEQEHWVKEVRSRKNANISDHAPFVMKNVPAVFVYVMGGKTGGYHQPDDTSDNCSLSAYNNTVKLFLKALEELGK